MIDIGRVVTQNGPMNDNAPMLSPESKQRFASLDGLRGLTIMLLIFVNNPGSWGHVYPPVSTRAVARMYVYRPRFPFFLFIAGSAMYFSSTTENHKIMERNAYEDLSFGSQSAN